MDAFIEVTHQVAAGLETVILVGTRHIAEVRPQAGNPYRVGFGRLRKLTTDIKEISPHLHFFCLEARCIAEKIEETISSRR